MFFALIDDSDPQTLAIALDVSSHKGFTRNLLREHCGKLTVLKSPKQPILVDAHLVKSDL
jgi:hypothetical protein